MDMPDKIWVTERDEEMDHHMLRAGMWTNGPMHSRETIYTRTDLAQSLADALEKIASDESFTGSPKDKTGELFARQDMARAALKKYRGE